MAIFNEDYDSESDSSFGSSSSSSTVAAADVIVGDNTFAKKRPPPSQSDSQKKRLKVETFPQVYGDLKAKLCLAEHNINPAKAEKFEKKRKTKKQKTEKGPPNPYIKFHPLDISEQESWLKFKEVDEAAGYIPSDGLSPQTLQTDSKPVEDDAIKSLIGDFAIKAFNNSYQMYVNKDNNKNLSDARFRECKYIKLEMSYLFYLTIEAVEQGNLGVYESAARFKSDGARALDMFVLTDSEPSSAIEGAKFIPEFNYETVKDGLTDPEEYYEDSGMVRRRANGGGYNYHRPFCYNGWFPW